MSDINQLTWTERGVEISNAVIAAATSWVSDDVNTIGWNPERYANARAKIQEEKQMQQCLIDVISWGWRFHEITTFFKSEVIDSEEEDTTLLAPDSFRRWAINYITEHVSAEKFIDLLVNSTPNDKNSFASFMHDCIWTTMFGEGMGKEINAVIDTIFKDYKFSSFRNSRSRTIALQELKNAFYLGWQNYVRVLRDYFGVKHV